VRPTPVCLPASLPVVVAAHRPAPAAGATVIVTAVGVFATLYLAFVRTPAGQLLDQDAMYLVSAAMSSHRWADLLLELVSGPAVTVTAVVLAATTAAWGRPVRAMVGLGVVTSVLALGELLQAGPSRPELLADPTVNSLPSGHVAAVAGLMAALVLSVPRVARHWVTVLIAAPATLLTRVATVAAEWHRPSDVLAALCLAITGASVGRGVLAHLVVPRNSTTTEPAKGTQPPCCAGRAHQPTSGVRPLRWRLGAACAAGAVLHRTAPSGR
jgi:membrane-associated phospholipid phosphatase